MATANITEAEVWVLGTEAAAILGADLQAVMRMGRSGYITTKKVPCCRVRYLRSDIERIASQAIRPATATG